MTVDLERTVEGWRKTLCRRVELAGLYSRNPIAHKWKTTYRSIVLRELVCWRITDLLGQIEHLQRTGHMLGAVILVRSAFETLAVLIYLNRKTESVFSDPKNFFELSNATSRLMLGSKNQTTRYETPNILTVLAHCDKRYPGFSDVYAYLSESAHPNFEGVCLGYSSIDEKNYVTEFSNRWQDLYSARLPGAINLCVRMFESEYNDVWPTQFSKLEAWLEANDKWLEENKTA